MPVEYSYFFRGEQKKLEQTAGRGRRISILGLMQPSLSFIYGLVVGGFNSERYIKMMDRQATQAQKELEYSGRIRVIVQDNGPVHPAQSGASQMDRLANPRTLSLLFAQILLPDELN
jgi:putative transposase